MRTSDRKDSNGRPLATIIVTTKGGEIQPSLAKLEEFQGSSILEEAGWNSCLSNGEETSLNFKSRVVQVSLVLDSAFCPQRRSSQVDGTFEKDTFDWDKCYAGTSL